MRFARLGPALVLALVAVVVFTTTASAHIAMTFPTPRSEAQKTGPCGSSGSKRGTNITPFSPGQTITVEWDETVGHPGHYRIAFDDSGDDAFRNPNNPDDNFASTLVEPIADRDGTQHYSQEVTLPDTPCDNCTLQLVQVMTTSIPYNSFYYQCADITIGEGGGPGTDPDGGGDDGLGGGCSAGGTPRAGLLLIGAALLAIRRRRRR